MLKHVETTKPLLGTLTAPHRRVVRHQVRPDPEAAHGACDQLKAQLPLVAGSDEAVEGQGVRQQLATCGSGDMIWDLRIYLSKIFKNGDFMVSYPVHMGRTRYNHPNIDVFLGKQAQNDEEQ